MEVINETDYANYLASSAAKVPHNSRKKEKGKKKERTRGPTTVPKNGTKIVNE